MRDNNSVIGIILMVLLTVAYFTFRPTPEPTKPKQTIPTEQAEQSTTNPTDPSQSAADPTISDSAQQAQQVATHGAFAALMDGEEQFVTVSTDKLDLTISTKGGTIVEAKLKDYQTSDSLALPIISKELEHQLYFEFVNKQTSQPVKSKDLYFSPSTTDFSVTGENTKELVMTAQIADGSSLQQVYTFKGDSYDVDYDIRMQGMQPFQKNRYYEVKWNAQVPKTEYDITPQRQKTQVVYMQGDDLERLGGMSDDYEDENVKGSVNWISYKSQFFSHVLISKDAEIEAPRLGIGTPVNSETVVKEMTSDFQVDMTSTDENTNSFIMYMGPNEYQTLRSYDVGLQKEMDLGYLFISQINVVTIYVFKFFEKYIPNYGLIILLFAILVKLIVFPLTYRSYVSMAKLRVLNQTPEMKSLDEKFKDDPQKQQMEKMAIYRKMGVSPLGGCLPMLLQWPILISMFFFFPQSVELRQKAFLWAHDLSTYDSILELGFKIPGYGDHVSLFTILMAISIYVFTFFQQKSQPTNTAMPFMKYLPYIFPLIFVIFLNNYASGLSWYYFAANLISIIQTTSIRASLNDEKLLAEMRSNMKKGGKNGKKGKNGKSKGRLEGWVERQQKKQEEMMRQRQQASKKGGNRNSRRKK